MRLQLITLAENIAGTFRDKQFLLLTFKWIDDNRLKLI